MQRLVEPSVNHLGFELWGVEQTGTGKRARVCIYIDSPNGVTVDDCEAVSRQVSTLLSVEDGAAGEYALEISSPGLDRRLFKAAHFEGSVGESIDVQLHLPINGSRRFRGTLESFEADVLSLDVDDEVTNIPLKQVRRARVIPSFA